MWNVFSWVEQRFELEQAKKERDHLARLQAYVLRTLDEMGVPKDPTPHGCRIAGRLSWVRAQLEQMKKEKAVTTNERDANPALKALFEMEDSYDTRLRDARGGRENAIAERDSLRTQLDAAREALGLFTENVYEEFGPCFCRDQVPGVHGYRCTRARAALGPMESPKGDGA